MTESEFFLIGEVRFIGATRNIVLEHLEQLRRRLGPHCSLSANSQVVILAVAFGFFFAIGSTWSASANGDYAKPTAMLFSLMMVLGGLGHFLRELTWRTQVLDHWVWMWLGLIGLSTVFNAPHALWNVLHAVWFCAALWLVWTVVADLIGNNVLTRATLADALLLGSLFPVWTGIQSWWLNSRRDSGFSTLDNGNYYATFLEFLIPLAWGRWKVSRNPIYLPLLGGLIVGAIASESRGLVIAMGSLLLFFDRSRRWIYILLGVPAVALLAYLRPHSVWERLPIYQHAWNEFLSSPILGTGPFTFRFSMAHLNSLQAHNLVMQTASELGALGVIFLGCQILWVWKVFRRIQDPMQMAWATSVVMTCAHQMVDVTWINPGMSLLMVLSITAAVEPASASDRPPRKFQMSYTVLVIAIAITLYVFAWRNGGVHQDTLTGVVGW